MKRAFETLQTIADFGGVASLVGIIAVVALQVFARFFLDQAPPWTEEASRVFFLYLVAFGIGSAVRNDALVQLDMIRSILPVKAMRVLQACIYLSTTIFAALLVRYAWLFTETGSFETSPAIAVSMSFLFASMLLLAISVLLFSLEKFLASVFPSRFR